MRGRKGRGADGQKPEERKRVAVVFDIEAARPVLKSMGIDEHEVDHVVEISDLVATKLAGALDDLVAKRSDKGLCMHPESICIAMAVLAEWFVKERIESSGEKVLDPVACIEMVRKFSEVEVDEDEDEDETPKPVTIH